MRTIGLALCLVLTVAACGGSSRPPTLRGVASIVGCKGLKQAEAELYTREAANCTKGSKSIYIATFANNTARDSWIKAAENFGGGKIAHGDKWVTQTTFVEATPAPETATPTSDPSSELETCAEIFPTDGASPLNGALDVANAYAKHGQASDVDVPKARRLQTRLGEISATAPPTLEPPLNDVASGLQLLIGVAESGEARFTYDEISPMIEGSQTAIKICDKYTD